MIKEIERTKPLAEAPAPEGTWFQITFTLNPEHYRTLWERAEDEHKTIPSLIREHIIDSLSKTKTISRKKEFGFKEMKRRK